MHEVSSEHHEGRAGNGGYPWCVLACDAMKHLHRHLWRLLVASALALALTACPGTDDDDDADDDVSADDDTTDSGICDPLTGSWRLIQFECGEYDITDDWFAAILSTTIAVVGTADSCSMALTNASDSCVEVQEFLYTVGEDTLSGESLGIVNCDPDACKFTEEDAPCEVGDGAGGSTGEASFTVVGDVLTVTNEEPEGLCGELTMVQTWERI